MYIIHPLSRTFFLFKKNFSEKSPLNNKILTMMMRTGTRTGNPGLPADLLEDGTYNQTQQVEENIDTFTPQCKFFSQCRFETD